MRTAVLLQVFLVLLPSVAFAWVERLNVGKAARIRSPSTALMGIGRRKDNSDDDGNKDSSFIEEYRAALESSYFDDSDNDVLLHGENFILLRGKEERIGLFHDIDSLTSSVYENDDDWLDGDVAFCGDECETQCEIPEEYKLLPDDQQIDVMAFLGLHRAEPLRVEHEASVMEGEWE